MRAANPPDTKPPRFAGSRRLTQAEIAALRADKKAITRRFEEIRAQEKAAQAAAAKTKDTKNK